MVVRVHGGVGRDHEAVHGEVHVVDRGDHGDVVRDGGSHDGWAREKAEPGGSNRRKVGPSWNVITLLIRQYGVPKEGRE